MIYEVKFIDQWTCSIRENQIHVGWWDNDLHCINGKNFPTMQAFRDYLDSDNELTPYLKEILEYQYTLFQSFFATMKTMGGN